VIKRSTNGSDW